MKKKVAISATAIAVLASAVPAQVSPVQAAGEALMDVVYVDHSRAVGQDEIKGTGTPEDPCTQLTTALEKVRDGGTIIIKSTAFVNDLESNSAPWYITKNVTIKSNDTTAPSINIRKGGIILGADVKFQNVELNMPNSVNDLYANGHKLELVNVVTTAGASPIDVYGGSYSSTYPSGSQSEIIIETDSNFRANAHGTNKTVLGAIYAGSREGSSSIPVTIKVNTPYVDSNLSIDSINGRGPGGQVNNADVNIKLNGLLFPTVDGYTGSSAKTNVEVTNQSQSGKSFNFLNVNKLTLARGEIQVRNTQLAQIPEVHLATGTTLNLKNAAPEVTIGTYTGDGIVIIPKTGLLNVTSGVTGSNNLELAVDFYFNNASDKAEENHVYVITPKGSNINFTPASSQSGYNLYPFEDGSDLQWKFVHNNNKPIVPTPDDEEGDGLPTIIEFIISTDNQNITKTLDDFKVSPQVVIPFSIRTTEELDDIVFLEAYTDLKVTVEGHEVVSHFDVDDYKCFYVEDLNMYIYLQPDDGDDLTQQKILVEFKDEDGTSIEPREGTYKIGLSLNGKTLNTTLVVGDEEEPGEPVPPGGGADGGDDSDGDDEENGEDEPSEPTLTDIKLKTTDFLNMNYSDFGVDKTPNISYTLGIETTGRVQDGTTLDFFKPTIKVGQEEAKLVETETGNYYRVDDLNLNISFRHNPGTKDQFMDITFVDDDGQPIVPTKDRYEFAISKGDIDTVTFTLAIEDFPKPTVQGFTQNSYTYEGISGLEIPIDFEVQFDEKPSKPVEFHELEGSKVSFLGEEWTYEDGLYRHEHHVFGLEIKAKDEVGKYTATFKDPDGQYTVPIATHSFTLEASGKQTKLDYKVKLHITNLTAEGEVEKTFTLEDFNNSFFTFNADVDNEFSDLTTYNGFDIVVNGKPATPQINEFDGTFSYIVQEENAKVHFTKISEGKYNLHVSAYDGSTTPPEPKSDKYVIEFKNYGVSPLTFTAKVNRGEESKEIVVTGVEFPETNTKKLESESLPFNLEIPVNFNFKDTTTPISFADLGYTFTINGEQAVYNSKLLSYVAENNHLALRVDLAGDINQFEISIAKLDHLNSGYQPLLEGIYNVEAKGPKDFNLTYILSKPVVPTPDVPSGGDSGSATPDNPSTQEPGNTGGSGSQEPVNPPTPPTTDDKEEEKEEPTQPPSTEPDKPKEEEPTTPPAGGGGNNGGSSTGGGSNTGTATPTTPPQPEPEKPSGGSGNGTPSQPSGGTPTTPSQPSGGSSNTGTVTPPPSNPSTGGGTNLPAPDPKPQKPVEQPPTVTPQPAPTPVPPQQEVTRPTVKPGAIASAVEALEELAETIKEKVDSLMTEVIEQAKGLVLDLTGDKDDLSSVSTLEVTKDGVFANVEGQLVKFATDLKLDDLSKLRITRADGSPIPYKTDGTGFTLNTHNFSDILITERVVEPFVDVAKDDWFQPYVDEMYNRGITTGTTATTFSPNASITRAQLAALLARTYELKPTGEKPVLTDTADQWYAADVQALVDLGIIKGYGDGTFRGDEPITREHLAMMLQRLAEKLGKDANPVKESNFTDTAKMSAEGKSAIQWAAEQGIINSGKDTAFKPKESATRAQVAKMLTLFINK